MKFSTRQRLMASTLLIGAAAFASPAWAQETPAAEEPPISSTPEPQAQLPDDEPAGEIVVTGSRIPRRDLTSSSPVAVVSNEEFALSGAVNVENVLNTLPQVTPSLSSFSNNPGNGTALLNLRGLGVQRNLVLVNGRRYIFFDANQLVDLNTIPAFLIESVDLVTGGASAVYGSDALAGVTNFHLRSDLTGALVGGTFSLTGKGDGARFDLYGALGAEFADGRGHVTVYGSYFNRGDIFQDARGFSTVALGDGATDLIPLGSAGVPQGRFPVFGPDILVEDGPPVITEGTNYGGAGAFFQTPGTSIPYCGGPCSYNYAPSNYLMIPQKRWTLGGYGEYEVIDGVNLYGEVAFINNRVEQQLAATPISQRVYVPLANLCGVDAPQPVSTADCDQLTLIAARQAAYEAANPGTTYGAFNAGAGSFNALQPGEVALVANYRFTQIANRVSSDDRNAFRMLGGVRGAITDEINYDVYYSYARTKNANVQIGNVSRSAFVTNVENGTCNIFGANQLSDECIDNVSIRAQNQDTSQLQVAQGLISGNTPLTLPWANEAVGFAIGAEWRSMSAEFIPDTALSSGDVAGFNAGDPTAGDYNAKEVFGELRVPIVEDRGIHKLELSGAFRYSDYSLQNVGGVWTYAGGVEFAPIRDVTFRGQYQRAVRAPNVAELFGGQAIGFPPATDPCSNRTPVADRTDELRALCVATGVPAANVFQAFIQPNAQIEGAFGGNPLLEEEVGDTYTLGAVIQPRFIPRLNITLDWYKIRVKNAVAVLGGSVDSVLDICYNEVKDPNSPFCQAIARDAQGAISGGGEFIVTANNANLAELNTKGWDLQVDYTQPLNFGLFGPASKLNFFFFGNYTTDSSFIPAAGLEEIQCAGKFGLTCGQPTPKTKWTSRILWQDGPLTSTVRWRHIGKVDDDAGEGAFIVDKLDAYNLFDLAFQMDVTDNATLSFGINNMFNKKPPIMGSNQEQANTYPSTYDVLGRDFFVSAAFSL